ncbi:MAG: FecR domain-containing protein [Gammaproteobacteria bacterium]|nr:FecR domain-containing protein [Gammaproteobacteria bacterium]
MSSPGRDSDLVITNPDGETFIVHDYFSFQPPPTLILENGAALSPEMVAALMPNGLEGLQLAGPATSVPLPKRLARLSERGEVVIIRNGQEITAERGMRIQKGDIIETGERSFVNIRLDDGAGADSTRFNLGAESKASLDDFAYDEDQEVGRFETTVQRGGFKYKSGNLGDFGDENRHTQISTPSAVIGVRGSELEGAVDPVTGETVVVQMSGLLEVADVNGNNPQTLDASGETATVIQGGTPTLQSGADPAAAANLDQYTPPPASDQADEQIDQEDAEIKATRKRARAARRANPAPVSPHKVKVKAASRKVTSPPGKVR